MTIFALALLGLFLGSFVNALVWRLHKQQSAKTKKQKDKLSISSGRSMCVHCGHRLSSKDLVPVVSWLLLKGKCRYCRRSISWQYPVVELATALLFVVSYIFWPSVVQDPATIIHFILWLIALTGLVALIVYDLRWMLLPNKIIFPLYIVAALFVLLQFIQSSNVQHLISAIYGVAIGGGIFYVLFQLSAGRWIGGGDVKLGFLLGALVGGPINAFMLLFIASLLGSFVSVPLLIGKKATKSSRIPFGPFLIVAAVIVQLFSQQITGWYLESFLY